MYASRLVRPACIAKYKTSRLVNMYMGAPCVRLV